MAKLNCRRYRKKGGGGVYVLVNVQDGIKVSSFTLNFQQLSYSNVSEKGNSILAAKCNDHT
jgi:hypothetical protein